MRQIALPEEAVIDGGFQDGERVRVEYRDGHCEGYVDETINAGGYGPDSRRPWEGSGFVPVRMDGPLEFGNQEDGFMVSGVTSLCPLKRRLRFRDVAGEGTIRITDTNPEWAQNVWRELTYARRYNWRRSRSYNNYREAR
jgi:hypothetical protein